MTARIAINVIRKTKKTKLQKKKEKENNENEDKREKKQNNKSFKIKTNKRMKTSSSFIVPLKKNKITKPKSLIPFSGFVVVTAANSVSFVVSQILKCKNPNFVRYRFKNSLKIPLQPLVYKNLDYFQIEIQNKGKFLICMSPKTQTKIATTKVQTTTNDHPYALKLTQTTTTTTDGFKMIMNRKGEYFLYEIVVPNNFPDNVQTNTSYNQQE